MCPVVIDNVSDVTERASEAMDDVPNFLCERSWPRGLVSHFFEWEAMGIYDPGLYLTEEEVRDDVIVEECTVVVLTVMNFYASHKKFVDNNTDWQSDYYRYLNSIRPGNYCGVYDELVDNIVFTLYTLDDNNYYDLPTTIQDEFIKPMDVFRTLMLYEETLKERHVTNLSGRRL